MNEVTFVKHKLFSYIRQQSDFYSKQFEVSIEEKEPNTANEQEERSDSKVIYEFRFVPKNPNALSCEIALRNNNETAIGIGKMHHAVEKKNVRIIGSPCQFIGGCESQDLSPIEIDFILNKASYGKFFVKLITIPFLKIVLQHQLCLYNEDILPSIRWINNCTTNKSLIHFEPWMKSQLT